MNCDHSAASQPKGQLDVTAALRPPERAERTSQVVITADDQSVP